MNKGIVLFAILAVSIFLTGCGEQAGTPGNMFIGGTEGLKASFVDGTPPSTIMDNGLAAFGIAVKLENVGESTVDVNKGYIQVIGLDPNAFDVKASSTVTKDTFKKKIDKINGAKISADGSTLKGGTTVADFGSLKYTPVLQGDTAAPFQANICYKYSTTAVSQLCIKTSAEQALSNNDICSVEGEKNPQNSGAPMQVTSIKESFIGDDNIGLAITITHSGSGDGFFEDSGDVDCDTSLSNNKKDKVKVTIKPVTINGKELQVKCSDLGDTSSGVVSLYSEADKKTKTMYCSLDTSGSGIKTISQVPITVVLDYDYLQHLSQELTIRHVAK